MLRVHNATLSINRIREALLLCEAGITLECVEYETAIDKTRSA